MKISLINTSLKGGASKSAQRLYLGLDLLNCDVNFIVKNRKGSEGKIISEFREVENLNFFSKIKKKFLKDSFLNRDTELNSLINERSGFGLDKFSLINSDWDISNITDVQSSDIVNIHWVADFLDISTFFKNVSRPIFWTLHDEAPYSYGEHYNEKFIFDDKGQYVPRKKTSLQIKFENKIRDQKIRYFEKVANLQIVGPSKWICDQSKKSELFSNFPIHNIPYGINTDIFKFHNKEFSKGIFDLKMDCPTILFVADTFDNNRKGFRFLYQALELLCEHKLNLLVLGSGKLDNYKFGKNHNIYYLGTIIEEILMSIAYNAADLFIIPSLMDNLPNTAIESICCGTPVIGFEVGGIPDIVKDGENGYLSKTMSAESLAENILKGLNNLTGFNNLEISTKAREKYHLRIQAIKYLELFDSAK
jgi:glycosyltransferase involved in cell wall biosynthesis